MTEFVSGWRNGLREAATQVVEIYRHVEHLQDPESWGQRRACTRIMKAINQALVSKGGQPIKLKEVDDEDS